MIIFLPFSLPCFPLLILAPSFILPFSFLSLSLLPSYLFPFSFLSPSFLLPFSFLPPSFFLSFSFLSASFLLPSFLSPSLLLPYSFLSSSFLLPFSFLSPSFPTLEAPFSEWSVSLRVHRRALDSFVSQRGTNKKLVQIQLMLDRVPR